MKKTDIKDLENKSYEELANILRNLRTQIKKSEIDRHTGKIKNTSEIILKKRDVARILTFMKKLEIKKQ